MAVAQQAGTLLPLDNGGVGLQSGFQFEQNIPWIDAPAIRYHLGVDGLSMWMIVLTGLLAPLGVLISWRAISGRPKDGNARLSNLMLTMLQKMNVQTEKFVDSLGPVSEVIA